MGGSKPFGKTVTIGGGIIAPKTYHAFDDSSIPSKEYFAELERVSKNRIIWGGNYFLDYLGKSPHMIVWDKDNFATSFSDFEIAWTSFKGASHMFRFRWAGMLQGDMKNREQRFHPTQKPVALYRWIYQHYAHEGDRILDTHLGSGSSRIAAYEAGLDFVGFEIDEYYYKLEEERFAAFSAQERLF